MALELFVVDTLVEQRNHGEGLRSLQRQWERLFSDSAPSSAEVARRDREFHETLARWTGNETLVEHLVEINERIHAFRVIEFAQTEVIESTCLQHRRILEALVRGDSTGAREAVRENIESAKNNVASTIKEALARSYS